MKETVASAPVRGTQGVQPTGELEVKIGKFTVRRGATAGHERLPAPYIKDYTRAEGAAMVEREVVQAGEVSLEVELENWRKEEDMAAFEIMDALREKAGAKAWFERMWSEGDLRCCQFAEEYRQALPEGLVLKRRLTNSKRVDLDKLMAEVNVHLAEGKAAIAGLQQFMGPAALDLKVAEWKEADAERKIVLAENIYTHLKAGPGSAMGEELHTNLDKEWSEDVKEFMGKNFGFWVKMIRDEVLEVKAVGVFLVGMCLERGEQMDNFIKAGIGHLGEPKYEAIYERIFQMMAQCMRFGLFDMERREHRKAMEWLAMRAMQLAKTGRTYGMRFLYDALFYGCTQVQQLEKLGVVKHIEGNWGSPQSGHLLRVFYLELCKERMKCEKPQILERMREEAIAAILESENENKIGALELLNDLIRYQPRETLAVLQGPILECICTLDTGKDAEVVERVFALFGGIVDRKENGGIGAKQALRLIQENVDHFISGNEDMATEYLYLLGSLVKEGTYTLDRGVILSGVMNLLAAEDSSSTGRLNAAWVLGHAVNEEQCIDEIIGFFRENPGIVMQLAGILKETIPELGEQAKRNYGEGFGALGGRISIKVPETEAGFNAMRGMFQGIE